PPPSSPLFPYTTLFRSSELIGDQTVLVLVVRMVIRFHFFQRSAEIVDTLTEHIPESGIPGGSGTCRSVHIHIEHRCDPAGQIFQDRKSTRLNSSHVSIS